MEKSAVILRIRNDADLYPVFIKHYEGLGIKDFFIMLHRPSDDLLDAISSSQSLANIRILWWNREGKGADEFDASYLHILTDTALNCGFKWIIAADADEFYILRKHNTFQDFLVEYDGIEKASLLFRWANYYPDFTFPQQHFTKWSTRSHYLRWTKAIGRFDHEMKFFKGQHWIENLGNCDPPLKEIRIDPEIAFCAHYPYRSREQYIEKGLRAVEKGFPIKRIHKEDPQCFEKQWTQIITGAKNYPEAISIDEPLPEPGRLFLDYVKILT